MERKRFPQDQCEKRWSTRLSTDGSNPLTHQRGQTARMLFDGRI